MDVETAKAAGRPGFEEMVAYFKMHRACRVLLVEKVDRLYRNYADMAAIQDLDLEVHLVKESTILSKDSRASDKLHARDQSRDWPSTYSDNLSEEVKKGMRTKAAQGLWPSSAPLGYRNTVGSDQKRIIVPDPALAPMVTSLFESFATAEYSLEDAGATGLPGRLPLPQEPGERSRRPRCIRFCGTRSTWGNSTLAACAIKGSTSPW